MPVQLWFYNIVIPIEKIPSFDKHLADNDDRIGWSISYDEYLYLESDDSADHIAERVRYWESLGLVGRTTEDGTPHWDDFCCIELGVCPEIKCNWLRYDPFRNNVFHPLDKSKCVVLTKLGGESPDNRILEGRYLSTTGVARGAIAGESRVFDNYETLENLNSKGAFRREVSAVGVDQAGNGEIWSLTIHDFAAHNATDYAFTITPNRILVLDLQADLGSLRIDYWPRPPETATEQTTERMAAAEVAGESDAKVVQDGAQAASDQQMVDQILQGIASGQIALKPSVSGRQVSINTHTWRRQFNPAKRFYFIWPTGPQGDEAQAVPLEDAPLEAQLTAAIRRRGYKFTNARDPYQVDWKRTLFLEVHEHNLAASETTVEIFISKISLAYHAASGQPSLETERIWTGTFALESSFYIANREHLAERISQVLGGPDIEQIEEW